MRTNWHVLMRRLFGHPTCLIGRHSRVGPRGRIFNIGKNSHLIEIGSHTVVEGELLVFRHGGRIQIGDWCFVGEGSRIWSGRSVLIRDRVLIAHSVNIFDNLTHPLAPHERHKHYKHIIESGHPADIDLGDRPVLIEDDAWIGAAAIVLRGVTIGRGAVVAAGAVVTSDVPPMTIVAGNPARHVRSIEER